MVNHHAATRGIKPPLSAQRHAETIPERMPSRTVLEALYNTDQWSGWTRHFGPPGRLSSQIEDRQRRCVLTTFAIGCGLNGATARKSRPRSLNYPQAWQPFYKKLLSTP
jgi:hypothetical protein